MIEIKNSTALEILASRLFKKKRKTPSIIVLESNCIRVWWKNNRYTSIEAKTVHIMIRSGDIIITIYPQDEKLYQKVHLLCDITQLNVIK